MSMAVLNSVVCIDIDSLATKGCYIANGLTTYGLAWKENP